MKDETIRKLLRQLPRDTASVGLKARVMERLSEPRTSAKWSGALIPAVAVVIVAAVVATPILLERGGRNRQEALEAQRQAATRQRVELLQREYRSLERELEDLRLMAAESQPVLGVQGDDQYDYIFDLRDVLPMATPVGQQVRPVSYDGRR